MNVLTKIQTLSFQGKLTRTTLFRLRNEETSGYIHANPKYDFNNSNCGRVCPIKGHYEVSGIKVGDSTTSWQIEGGLFF